MDEGAKHQRGHPDPGRPKECVDRRLHAARAVQGAVEPGERGDRRERHDQCGHGGNGHRKRIVAAVSQGNASICGGYSGLLSNRSNARRAAATSTGEVLQWPRTSPSRRAASTAVRSSTTEIKGVPGQGCPAETTVTPAKSSDTAAVDKSRSGNPPVAGRRSAGASSG